ncbi:GNAT family N-acetyltransferase [Enterococcus sp. 5H]|uniref:GNAT family N-acetyltransferase n=1 Tax=Enterococcus sp. 5H TaxID=1229490 RepID=UPI0023035069|nr:GNAT family N-acetyltransferase [Enterococcus sp. 5H]MDA9469951.1 GCN5-related N-acetyltransferase [Enterococcus sp. 5H]
MHIHFGSERWHQAAAFALRYEVFVLEQGILPQDEFDSLDISDRNYFVAYEDSLVIGTIRYQKKDDITIQPDRLCIKKNFRGKGFGKKLLLLLEQKAINEGCQFSLLSAETSAILFYENLGYSIHSDEYLEDGILCVKMSKKISS